jgi:hypothetical protein
VLGEVMGDFDVGTSSFGHCQTSFAIKAKLAG